MCSSAVHTANDESSADMSLIPEAEEMTRTKEKNRPVPKQILRNHGDCSDNSDFTTSIHAMKRQLGSDHFCSVFSPSSPRKKYQSYGRNQQKFQHHKQKYSVPSSAPFRNLYQQPWVHLWLLCQPPKPNYPEETCQGQLSKKKRTLKISPAIVVPVFKAFGRLLELPNFFSIIAFLFQTEDLIQEN